MRAGAQATTLIGPTPSDRTTPWILAAAIATTTAGLMTGPLMTGWNGSVPPIVQPAQRPFFQNAMSSDGVGAPAGLDLSSQGQDVRASDDTVAKLRVLTGLTGDQLGRLFGVSRRSIQGWIAGAPMAAPHQERLSFLLARVAPLGTSADERKRKLLSSAAGTSLFHQLVDEAGKDAVLQVRASSVRERLGV